MPEFQKAAGGDVLLDVRDVSYTYPQSQAAALRGVSLRVRRGEYVALLGANGSGKSTLARMMAGFFPPDAGAVEMADGVLPGIVFQQPKEQIVAGVVERDTAFGPQNLDMDAGEIELRTLECLSVVSLADRAASRTFELSLGQTQRLAFSGILALFPDVLILDEVTAMLDPRARQSLVQFIDRWQERGHTVIHVTHDEDEALHARRIVVLDGGAVLFDGSREAFMQDAALVGRVFGDDGDLPAGGPVAAGDAPVLLSVDRLGFAYPERQVFRELTFALRRGTLTALTGGSGCGKSTLFECLAGLKEPLEGTIRAVSRPVLALQESEAALFAPYAADDVAFGPRNRGVQGRALVERVKGAMALAGLPYAEFADRNTFRLSGGEKRKLSIAGLVALDADVLIFDEPTSALDPASRRAVLRALRSLAVAGKAVLFSTHRLEEADYADVRLSWEALAAEGADAVSAGEDLPEQRMMPNAGMLAGLQRTAAALMAPPHIPESPVGRLPDVGKFALFFGLAVAALAAVPLWLCGAMLLASIIYARLARYPLRKPLRAYRALLPLLVFFAAVQFVFYSTSGDAAVLFRWHWFVITEAKLRTVLRTFLRAPALIITLGTYLFSTNERQILDGFAAFLSPLARLGVPVRYVVLVAGIIFRFVPLLLDELSGIIKTQLVRGAYGHARGLKKLRILIPLFVPLILQTFRKAQYLADALTARYFK